MAKGKKESVSIEPEELLVGGNNTNSSVLKSVVVFLIFHMLYLLAPVLITVAPVIIAYYYPAYRYIAIALGSGYWIYVFTDKSYKNNGAPWKDMENMILVRIILEWLPIRILRTTKLDKDKLYVFACHPHGTLAFSRAAVGFSTRTLWDLAFPNLKFRVLTASAPFFVPFIREFWLWSYCIDASKVTAVKAMRELKSSIFVYPGGELEQIETIYRKHIAMLSMRKGFIKLAIEEGADIVPVYTFGETDLYKHSHILLNFRKWLVKKFHVAIPFLYGEYGLMPYRIPVSMVFGKPIKIIQKNKPTIEEINKIHTEYCRCLLNLFNEYKERLGYKDAVLEIR